MAQDQVPGQDIAQGIVGGMADFNPITLLMKLLSGMGSQTPTPAPPVQPGVNPLSGTPGVPDLREQMLRQQLGR